jgi:imidazolonepropionase-like amidohydrolase
MWQTLLIPLIALAGAEPPNETPALVLTSVRILDTANGQFLEGRDVLIVGDRISRLAPSGEIAGPPGAPRVDLAWLTLLPGLIDLHSHLLLHPYNEASWNDQVLRESLELRAVRAVPAMRATLEAGFTTLRDMGTEGAGYADVGLRDAVNQGIVPGPRVFTTTRALVATGCYGPSGFDPRWEMPVGAQVADGVDGVRRAVREQIAHGADWIKVYADYRRRPGDPATPTYSQDELNAIVDEAHSAGLRVAAHATTDEAIRRCIRAGVATIEHGSDASEEILVSMRDDGVVLCPTLAASEAMARYAGWSPGQPDHPRLVAAKAMFKRALSSGVTIACGSDVGVFPHGENARELELMVEYGMSPLEAVKAATVTAAAVLNRSEDLGRITDGFLGDLVAVDGDPLENISALRNPVVVIKGGRVVADRR